MISSCRNTMTAILSQRMNILKKSSSIRMASEAEAEAMIDPEFMAEGEGEAEADLYSIIQQHGRGHQLKLERQLDNQRAPHSEAEVI